MGDEMGDMGDLHVFAYYIANLNALPTGSKQPSKTTGDRA